jgi:hypothetical protein
VSRKLDPNSDIACTLVQSLRHIQATLDVELTFASRHTAAYPAAFLLVCSSVSSRMQCASVYTNNNMATSVRQKLLRDGDSRMTERNRTTEIGGRVLITIEVVLLFYCTVATTDHIFTGSERIRVGRSAKPL